MDRFNIYVNYVQINKTYYIFQRNDFFVVNLYHIHGLKSQMLYCNNINQKELYLT